MDTYVWEIVFILGVYVIAFFVYYRRESKLREETKGKLTDNMSMIEREVLTTLIGKSRHVKWEVKNPEWIRYIVMNNLSWDILFIRCKHFISRYWFTIFINENEVEMFSLDLKNYMNDNKCYARWLFITSCYTTGTRREQAKMNDIDLWDAFRWKRKLWRI